MSPDRPRPDLDEALRRWAARAPATPPSVAARRLAKRLASPTPTRRTGRAPFLLAATLAALVGSLVARQHHRDLTPPPPSTTVALPALEALTPVDDGVVVFRLEDDSLLYFTARPRSTVPGEST